MTDADPFAAATERPVWLMTLADLALLLVGFFVLLQANVALPSKELARGIAEGFGATPAPIAVEAQLVAGFAPAAAGLPAMPDTLLTWAKDATRDPRVALTVTGAVDGSAADTDPATGSGALLAADRARAVLAALAAAGVPVARATIATAPHPAGRRVVVTLAFAGEGETPK